MTDYLQKAFESIKEQVGKTSIKFSTIANVEVIDDTVFIYKKGKIFAIMSLDCYEQLRNRGGI